MKKFALLALHCGVVATCLALVGPLTADDGPKEAAAKEADVCATELTLESVAQVPKREMKFEASDLEAIQSGRRKPALGDAKFVAAFQFTVIPESLAQRSGGAETVPMPKELAELHFTLGSSQV